MHKLDTHTHRISLGQSCTKGIIKFHVPFIFKIDQDICTPHLLWQGDHDFVIPSADHLFEGLMVAVEWVAIFHHWHQLKITKYIYILKGKLNPVYVMYIS